MPRYLRTLSVLGVAILTAVTAVALATAPAAAAEDAVATRVSLAAPATASVDSTVALAARLQDARDGSPVGGKPVFFERRVGGSWQRLEPASTTDAQGEARRTVEVHAADNSFRVVFGGDETHTSSTSTVVTVRVSTQLSITTGRGYIGSSAPVTGVLRDSAGNPLAEKPVKLERRVDGAWRLAQHHTTNGNGVARATVRVRPSGNVFRWRFPGDSTHARSVSVGSRVTALRYATALTIGGPDRVVDERAVTLTLRWTASDGRGVRGPVKVYRKIGGVWGYTRTVWTNRYGRASYDVAPRQDTRWKAVGAGGTWWLGDTSNVHVLDNVPPGVVVQLPAGAPAPRISLTPQPRAVGTGANAVIRRIPHPVWRSMVGRSWHRGCPVGRPQLRLIRINYFGYDGYRYRGELVVRAAAADRFAAAFAEMHRRGYPIRAMYRVDRFGWSNRLQGADDYKSMAAGNTSAFNCRNVVGRPGVRSPHAYGYAVDVNTWENPYYSPQDGWLPNSWWRTRSHPLVAWRSRSHPVVQLMARHGLRWTYGVSDSHHFDA